MNYRDWIASSPDVMLGKPVIVGTRITVELILKKLSQGANPEMLLEAYPHLTLDDILASLAYSADLIKGEEPIAS